MQRATWQKTLGLFSCRHMKGYSHRYFVTQLWASVLLWTGMGSSAQPQVLFFKDPALKPGGPCVPYVRVDNLGVTLSFTSTDPEMDSAIYHVAHNADNYDICVDGNGGAIDNMFSPLNDHAAFSMRRPDPDCRPLLQVHPANSWHVTISPLKSSSSSSSMPVFSSARTNATEAISKEVPLQINDTEFCAVEVWLRLRPQPMSQSDVPADDKTLSTDADGTSLDTAEKYTILGYHAVYLWGDPASAATNLEQLWIARGCAQLSAEPTSAESSTITMAESNVAREAASVSSSSHAPISTQPLDCMIIEKHLKIARDQVKAEINQSKSVHSSSEPEADLLSKSSGATTSTSPQKQPKPMEVEDETDIITIQEPADKAELSVDCDVSNVWGAVEEVSHSSRPQTNSGDAWDESDVCRLTARHKGGSASLPISVDIDALAKGSTRHGVRASSNGLAAVLRANPLSFSLCYGVVSPRTLWEASLHSNHRRGDNYSDTNSSNGKSFDVHNNETSAALAAVASSITLGAPLPTVRPPQCFSLGDPLLQGPLPKVKIPFVLTASQFLRAARAKAADDDNLPHLLRGMVVLASWLQRSNLQTSRHDSSNGGRNWDNRALKSDGKPRSNKRIMQGVIGLSAVTFHLTLNFQSARPEFFPLPPLLPIHAMAPLPSTRVGPALFSVVVQGPLNAVSLTAVPGYLAVAKRVVVSCWNGADKLHLLEPLIRSIGPPTNLSSAAAKMYPEPDSTAKQVQSDWVYLAQPLPMPYAPLSSWELTTFYQFTSTLAALRYITTPFVVKSRSDEAFSDLGPLLAAASSYPRVLISSNIYLRVAAQQSARGVSTRRMTIAGSSIHSNISSNIINSSKSSGISSSSNYRRVMSLVSDHLFAGATTNIWAVSSLLVAAFDAFLDVSVETKAREMAAATAWVRCEATRARNREPSSAEDATADDVEAADSSSAANPCAEVHTAEPFFPGLGPHSSEMLLLRGFLDASGYGQVHPPESPECVDDTVDCPSGAGNGFTTREITAILNSQAVRIVPVSALAGNHGNDMNRGNLVGVPSEHSSNKTSDFGYRVACNQFGRNGAGMQASVDPQDVGRAEHALLLAYPSHAVYMSELRSTLPIGPGTAEKSFKEGAYSTKNAAQAEVDGAAAPTAVAVAAEANSSMEERDHASSITDMVAIDAFHDTFFDVLLRCSLDHQLEVFHAWFGADILGNNAATANPAAALTPFLAPLAARIAVSFLKRFQAECKGAPVRTNSSNYAEARRYAQISRISHLNYFTSDEVLALGL